MGIWIGVADFGGLERAVIADSVTERPLALPMFGSTRQAESFLYFAERRGIRDVRAVDSELLDQLHSDWLKATGEVK